MKVAIHQPQYLPWLPYMLKIKHSDIFILLDTVDFQKNGLQNRNQIKTAQGAQWLTVPVRQQIGQKIQDVMIDSDLNWRRKHWQSLQQNYRKSSYFYLYAQELEEFYAKKWDRLNDVNIVFLKMLLRWMNIQTPVIRSSEMIGNGAGSDLVLSLCMEVGATKYISGSGGKNYLEPNSFERSGIEILYQPPVLPDIYPQLHPQAGFINALSVIDLIFNCGDAWSDSLPVGGIFK